ncbi:MAG: winged helix DNA-binding protein [Candidatus Pacebacteria bacterium]|nr:winged helix DNA-binding protein [Candidatus Paceibacterota bacterium]
MAAELTKRQREALIAIHTLILRKGAGPTIREIRDAMDVASDQTVIEMLERLEKAGLISRDKKQARTTSLTDEARHALGIVSTNSANAADAPMGLDEQEQKVYDRLLEIDPRLGRMYKGSLSTLGNIGNEDRIAQSAHSMREIIDHLSNKGSASMSSEVREHIKKDRGTRRTIHGLRFFFDPQANIAAEQNPYKHLYDEYQTRLQNIAHHSERPDEATYKDLLKGLEYFLLRYVFPSQVEVYKLLEETLKKGPHGVDPADLLLLVKKNTESYRFFFKHADARWLSYLRDHHFLDATWEVGDYLSRVAQDQPAIVLEIFLATDMPKDEWGAKTAFATAASMLPANYTAKTIKKVLDEEWVKGAPGILLHYKLQDILATLLTGGEYERALVFADVLLDVFPEEYGSYGSWHTKAYVSEYEYEQMLKLFAELPPAEISPFLRMFVSKLVKMIATVHARGEKGDDDYSYIWRPAIEGHEQNHSYDRIDDCVISAVRDLLEKHIGFLVEHGETDEARRELEEVLENTPAYPILLRLKLHIYRLFPDAFKAEIEREVSSPRLSSLAWHEYSRLVNARFAQVTPKAKKKYFDVIDAQNKVDDKYIDSWRVRLVGLVKDSLNATQKKSYARLLKQAEKLDQPFFTSYHVGTSWVGPDSPKKEADLENKPVSEILELVKTWKPSGDEFFGPSRSGFGMALRNVVAKEGAKYSASARDFLDEGIRPVYIYNVLSGLVESLKNGAQLDWGATLDLASGIIARAKSGDLPPVEGEKKDRLEADWEDVMQEVARLIVRGLDTNGIPLDEKTRVWGVIEYVAENPDPTPEHEEKYGGSNSDPYTMSINTVRGDAFHAVFAYIFWFNRAEKNVEKSWTAQIPEEAKKVLEAHLEPAHDPSLAVRSVYGRFFPWMLSYGGTWAKALVPKIFPADEPNLRYAAWETYLSNMVFEEAYKLLRPQYEMALKDIRDGKLPKRSYWVDTTERLAEHTMTAYAFEVDENGSPFHEHFFANASGKCRGMAVSFGGRAFVSRDNVTSGDKMPRMELLQKFWDWRLENSDAPSELREFGWWTKLDKFDNEWMLERLLKTVEKTKGDINGEFIVMNSLKALAAEYPLLCGKILRHIFTSSNRRDRYAFLHTGELKDALIDILESSDEEAQKAAKDIVDYLLKLGFEDLRTLVDLTNATPME